MRVGARVVPVREAQQICQPAARHEVSHTHEVLCAYRMLFRGAYAMSARFYSGDARARARGA